MTLPKGWKPTSEKREEEEKMMQISSYSPDRGSLPKGWIYSSASNSDSGYNNVPQLKGKTKNKKTKSYSSSSYRASPKPTSSGSMIGIVIVFVIIIWLIIGAISGAFGYWWYYIMFFSLLGTALGSGRAWRSGYYASGMSG
jgi:hypothetical protein